MAVTVEIMEKCLLILQVSETFVNILDICKRYLCIELSVLRCKLKRVSSSHLPLYVE